MRRGDKIAFIANNSNVTTALFDVLAGKELLIPVHLNME